MIAGELAVVVVNYGSHLLLERHFAAVPWSEVGATVVVVDNRTSIAELRAVRTMCSRLSWELVESETNLGFGAGQNLGVARAVELGASVFVLANPDLELTISVLSELRDQVRASPLSLVSPRVLRQDGSIWFDGAEVGLEVGRTGRRGAVSGPTIPWLSGACLAISGTLWDRVGGFDEDYFLYWEDIDLSVRVARAGGRVCVRQDLEVLHEVGGTQGGGRAKSSTYYYYNARNRLLFAGKHLPPALIRRWMARTPGYAREVVLRGGRRQLLSPWSPISSVVRGSLGGLLAAGRAWRRAGRGAAGKMCHPGDLS